MRKHKLQYRQRISNLMNALEKKTNLVGKLLPPPFEMEEEELILSKLLLLLLLLFTHNLSLLL